MQKLKALVKALGRALVSRELFFCLAVAALFGAHWLAAAPGVMTIDSLSAYRQAKEHVYHDQHPPLMAWLWHWMLPFSDGPLPLFTLHLLMFWSAPLVLGLVFIRRRRWLAYMFPLLWLTPLFVGMPNAVWKDAGLAASWLLAVSLMMKLHASAKKAPLMLVLFIALLLGYGTCLRYNALAGVWPLCLWLGWLMARKSDRPKFGAFALSLVLFALMGGAQYALNILLVSKKTYFEQNLYYYDLNCLSSQRETPYFPDYITQDKHFSSKDYRRSQPSEASDAALFKLNMHFYTHFYSFKPEQVQALQQAWWNSINAYPDDYAACRLRQFRALSRFDYTTSYYPYEIPKAEAPVQPPLKQWAVRINAYMAQYLQTQKNQPYSLPWPHLALAVVVWLWSLLGLMFRARLRSLLLFPVQCLSLSALLYAASYLFAGIGLDGRFLYWTVAASGVALVVMILYACEWVSARRKRA